MAVRSKAPDNERPWSDRARPMRVVIATFARVEEADRFAQELYREVRVDVARATIALTPDPDGGREVAVVWAPDDVAASARRIASRMGGILHEP